jgi:hypothetical protein
MNSTIDTLNQFETAKENGIQMLAEPAFKRFYRSEGIFFENLRYGEGATQCRSALYCYRNESKDE